MKMLFDFFKLLNSGVFVAGILALVQSSFKHQSLNYAVLFLLLLMLPKIIRMAKGQERPSLDASPHIKFVPRNILNVGLLLVLAPFVTINWICNLVVLSYYSQAVDVFEVWLLLVMVLFDLAVIFLYANKELDKLKL